MADEHKNVPRCGTETEGMMPSKNDIIRMISVFNHDAAHQQIRKFLGHKDIFEILGVSRKEVNHSAFLAWLFDSTQDHGLDALPTSRLVDFVVQDILSNIGNRIKEDCGLSINYGKQKPVLEQLLYHNYRITRVKSSVEQSTDTNKRIDILTECDVQVADELFKVNIAIENKVASSLHTDQLNNYSRFIEANHKKDNEINLYVLIAPNPQRELEALKEAEKACQYVPVSYQDLIDEIITPSLAKSGLPVRTKVLLEEYMHVLGKPVSKNDISIMAMNSETKELLRSFYETHKDLLLCIMRALSEQEDDPEFSDEAKAMVNVMTKRNNSSRAYFTIDDEPLAYNKTELLAELVRRYFLWFEQTYSRKPFFEELTKRFCNRSHYIHENDKKADNTTGQTHFELKDKNGNSFITADGKGVFTTNQLGPKYFTPLFKEIKEEIAPQIGIEVFEHETANAVE